ncbi:uncharacterized protein LOC119737115 [Patiria miniata]|uniref:Ig-like domain-containing protein n=1 Tax=Patiria miniata TaxID=46514 RepID=A0A914ASW1_PATMI|nr:uncharacterized protein LOC119737115 [Patiria miniata]
MHKLIFICLMCWCCALQTTGLVVTLQKGPKNTSVTEGVTVTLDCIFHGLSPSFVYWYRHETAEVISLNSFISSDIEQDRQTRYKIIGNIFNYNSSLQMNDVKVTDSGTYSIYSDVSFRNQDHIATATLTVHPNKLGNSSSIPRCMLSAAPAQNTENGNLVNLTCLRNTDHDFEGSLTPELIWYRESPDDVISEPQRDQSMMSLYLHPEDNGVEFTCRLQYPQLGELGRTVGGECSMMPLRILPSSWIEPSGEVRVQENSDVIFSCNGTGIPAITAYQWRTHPELPLNRFELKNDGRVLRIKDLQKEDDALNVTCLAQIASGLTGDVSSAILKINGSNTTNMPNDMFNVPAVIIPILVVIVVMILLGIIWKYIQHKRKNTPVSKSSKDAAKSRSSPREEGGVPATPSPLPPRLAHYDYPSTPSSTHSSHSNKNYIYTDLDSNSHHEYLDLTGIGKNHHLNNENEYTDYLPTEGATAIATATQDLDADDYETFEIGN